MGGGGNGAGAMRNERGTPAGPLDPAAAAVLAALPDRGWMTLAALRWAAAADDVLHAAHRLRRAGLVDVAVPSGGRDAPAYALTDAGRAHPARRAGSAARAASASAGPAPARPVGPGAWIPIRYDRAVADRVLAEVGRLGEAAADDLAGPAGVRDPGIGLLLRSLCDSGELSYRLAAGPGLRYLWSLPAAPPRAPRLAGLSVLAERALEHMRAGDGRLRLRQDKTWASPADGPWPRPSFPPSTALSLARRSVVLFDGWGADGGAVALRLRDGAA